MATSKATKERLYLRKTVKKEIGLEVGRGGVPVRAFDQEIKTSLS